MIVSTGESVDADERIKRSSVAALDAILGKRFPLLNDGFVRGVDYMGSDNAIQAARVCYGMGTKRFSKDRRIKEFHRT
jgi:thymidylate synthase (FAD)